MTNTPWDALSAPFAATEVQWRIVKLSEDGSSAQVRPQLPVGAVVARFDAVLGFGGWAHVYRGLGERGLACTLSVGSVSRSAIAAYSDYQTLRETADDAFVAAAGLFGLQPTVLLAELPWVAYDAEAGQPLYDPDPYDPDLSAQGSAALRPEEAEDASGDAPLAAPPPLESAPTKSAGQQAIDKLVDRLKAEGRGLEAAKLLNAYGGYGSDPQTARELYAKLRELLLGAS